MSAAPAPARMYEATILVKAAAARTDYEGTVASVRQIYEAEGAQFVELEKWEERPLAYAIGGDTSALFLNAYFTATPASVEKIERRARLMGETIIRQLIIARPGKDYDRIRDQRAKQAAAAVAAAAAAATAQAAGSYDA